MERGEIIRRIRAATEEITEREFGHLEEDQLIADLGLDSLSTLELVGMIERELCIFLPTDELVDVLTIKQLTDLVETKLAAAT